MDLPAELEVRIDEPVGTAADVMALGIQVGDFVALDADPRINRGGYVERRHLDNKAGMAACLAALKVITKSGSPQRVPHSCSSRSARRSDSGHGTWLPWARRTASWVREETPSLA